MKNVSYRRYFVDLRKKELKIDLKPKDKNLILTGKLKEAYFKDKNEVENTIIFAEFLKEFISIYLHKYKFESLIENLFGLYSKQLDESYFQVTHHISSFNAFK